MDEVAIVHLVVGLSLQLFGGVPALALSVAVFAAFGAILGLVVTVATGSCL